MWFKLNTTFTQSLGTLSELSNSWSITRNLTNYSTTSTTTSVAKNGTYSATFTLNSGCTYSSHSVTMGGATVSSASTASATAYKYDSSTHTITFSNFKVTGALVITAVATGASSGGSGGTTPPVNPPSDPALDSIAYGGKTYREIFENGNKITTGNMITNSSLDDWTQFNTTPRVTVTTAEYCTPNFAIDATCTASAQVYKNIPGGLISNHKYYMAVKRKLTTYTKGTWCGFQTTDASNSDALIAGRDICNTFAISNEFVTLSKIYSMSATYNNVRYWIGCGGSAQLTAYIDDPMLIDLTEVFGSNIPSEAEMNVLYDKFLVMHGATIEVVDKPTSLDDIAHDNISYRTLFLDNNELNDMDMIDNDTINLIQYQTYSLPTVDNSVYNTPSVSMNITGTKSTQGYKECDISNNHNYFMGFNRNITAKTAGSRAGIWFTEEGQTGGTNASAEGLAVTDGWETRTHIYKYPGTKTKGMIWVGSGGGANLTGHLDDLVFVDLTKVFGDNIPSSAKMQQLYNNFVELCKNN